MVVTYFSCKTHEQCTHTLKVKKIDDATDHGGGVLDPSQQPLEVFGGEELMI